MKYTIYLIAKHADINIKIVGKPMLDKFLTGENVKVNGEIANRRNILRTLTPLLCQTCYYQTQK
jgi:hypothetical protein